MKWVQVCLLTVLYDIWIKWDHSFSIHYWVPESTNGKALFHRLLRVDKLKNTQYDLLNWWQSSIQTKFNESDLVTLGDITHACTKSLGCARADSKPDCKSPVKVYQIKAWLAVWWRIEWSRRNEACKFPETHRKLQPLHSLLFPSQGKLSTFGRLHALYRDVRSFHHSKATE